MRATLEQHAFQLVRENGPRAFTMADLSRRAGVSVAAPYKHFTDRQAVLLSLAVHGAREERDRIINAMAAEEKPEAKLIAFARAIVRFSSEDRALFETARLPGLELDHSEEASRYSDEVDAAVLAAAHPYSERGPDRLSLVTRIRAAARGVADFREQGALHPGRDSLADAEYMVERIVQALLVNMAPIASIGQNGPPPKVSPGP
jgi:AcrR family transcriptional regulator